MTNPWYDPKLSYEDNYANGPTEFSTTTASTTSVKGQYSFFGLPLRFPFGIPAGPLLNARYVQSALENGFDVPVYKTVRTRSYKSHPWPNVVPVKVEGDLTLGKASHSLMIKGEFDEPISITNSFGVPSQDPDVWQPDMALASSYAHDGQHVVGSCQGTHWSGFSIDDYIKDWAQAARLVKETGVSAVEINLSCPNEGARKLVCNDTDLSLKITDAVKDAIGDTPLVIKISYIERELEGFVAALAPIIDGISSVNSIPAAVVDESGNQALPGEGRLVSGICGASIKWAGLDMVQRLSDLRKKNDFSYTIFGVGGVMNSLDFIEYRTHGADIVMSATGAMWNSGLANQIKSAS